MSKTQAKQLKNMNIALKHFTQSVKNSSVAKDIQILLAQNNLELSKEYLAIAKFNQQYKKSYRGIIDLAY